MAMGLASLGFGDGQVASILSNTVLEWVLADLAVQSAGGVPNGIYPTDAAAQVEYLCADSRTTILFVEDDEQLDKALEVRGRLPRLERVGGAFIDALREWHTGHIGDYATWLVVGVVVLGWSLALVIPT
jgi:long-chain acyl-CoA synthetase